MNAKRVTCNAVSMAALFLAATFISNSHASRNANGTWVTLDIPDGPAARKHHAMVYDSNSKRVIVYGGENHGGPGGADAVLGDVWALNLDGSVGWSQLAPTPDPIHGTPSPRHGHQAIYVGSPPRMIIFGGRADFDVPEHPVSDAWQLSLTGTPTWTWLSDGPSQTAPVGCAHAPFLPRTHAAAAALFGLTVYGGRVPQGTDTYAIGDTWRLDLGTNTWHWSSGSTLPSVGVPGSCDFAHLPNFRYWHSAILDIGGSSARMVIFGGHYDDGVETSNAWVTTDGTTWSKYADAASDMTRIFHVAVYDPVSRRMIVYGGYAGSTGGVPIGSALSGVFTLDLPNGIPQNPTWQWLSPAGTSPGGRAEHAGVYSSFKDWMIVFGGVDATGALHEPKVDVLDFNDLVPPSTPTISGTVGKTTATVSWTSTGDDGTSGTANHYELRKATFQINSGNFSTATLVSTGTPLPPGNQECYETQGNTSCRTYYYALKVWDGANNSSALSNVLSMKQLCSGNNEVMCGGAVTAHVPTPELLNYRIASSNPTSGHTTLAFDVPTDLAGLTMDISIYDVAGRRVRALDQRVAQPGSFTAEWNHRGNDGRQVATGVYFARLQIGAHSLTQKIVITPR